MKAKVKFICNGPYNYYNAGQTGVIDTYMFNGKSVIAVVITDTNHIVPASLNDFIFTEWLNI